MIRDRFFNSGQKEGLCKLQRATQVLYRIFSNSSQTDFASCNELLKCCTEFSNSGQTGCEVIGCFERAMVL